LERAGTAASMNYVQIVFAFLFQVFLLGQKPAITSAVGAVLICTYDWVFYWKRDTSLRLFL
jgi:drug/metabolite transporter (DMT)-like permease